MKRDTRITWKHVAPKQLQLAGRQIAVIGGTGGLGRAISRVLADVDRAHVDAFLTESSKLVSTHAGL